MSAGKSGARGRGTAGARAAALAAGLVLAAALVGCGGGDDEQAARELTPGAGSGADLSEPVDSLAGGDLDSLLMREGELQSGAPIGQPGGSLEPGPAGETSETARIAPQPAPPPPPEPAPEPRTAAPRAEAGTGGREDWAGGWDDAGGARSDLGPWSLQVGSFRSPEAAEARAAELRDAGTRPVVVEATVHDVRYWRVVVPNLADRAMAEDLGRRLARNLGVEYLVRRH